MEEALIVAIIQIIAIDIILGGDNAIIIALACRNLPQRQKRLGILWGTAGAIILRCILVFFASTLLTIPSLKLIGGLLLLWIGIKLLADYVKTLPAMTPTYAAAGCALLVVVAGRIAASRKSGPADSDG